MLKKASKERPAEKGGYSHAVVICLLTRRDHHSLCTHISFSRSSVRTFGTFGTFRTTFCTLAEWYSVPFSRSPDECSLLINESLHHRSLHSALHLISQSAASNADSPIQTLFTSANLQATNSRADLRVTNFGAIPMANRRTELYQSGIAILITVSKLPSLRKLSAASVHQAHSRSRMSIRMKSNETLSVRAWDCGGEAPTTSRSALFKRQNGNMRASIRRAMMNNRACWTACARS